MKEVHKDLLYYIAVLVVHLVRLEVICLLYIMDVFGRPCLKIGDETFIIAALMAMRHPKSIVLSGALSALYVMTVGKLLSFFYLSYWLHAIY